jgi:Na+/H+ antiporter NhaD/arsenite permease-like protein
MKQLPWFFGLLGLVVWIASASGLTLQQIAATGIFASFILGTLFYWQFRLAFALIGATALLALKLIDIPHLIEFANVDIILFLIAMMIVIGFLEQRKFFEVLLEKMLDVISHRAKLFFPAMMVMSMVTAALVDEVTSILFMTSLTLHLTRRFKLPPFPYILMIVFATNIGSSATVVGNPIGVLIAMRAGLSFVDFIRWASPISVACLILGIGVCMLYFRRPLEEMAKHVGRAKEKSVEGHNYNKKQFQLAGLIFGLTIAGLIFHHQVEHLLHLSKNTLLIGFPFLMAGICLLIEGVKARELVEKRVDWWTLIFFLMLFASVGTLRYVGVTDRIAEGLTAVAGGNPVAFLALILFISALLTALLDNILVVATFVPIIADLGAAGLNIAPLWWALLFGGTMGGNATMIGSTANIVAIGMLEKEKQEIKFVDWLGPGLAVTIPTLLLAFTLLWLQLPLLGK